MILSLVYLVAFSAAMLVISSYDPPQSVWGASFGKNTTESIQPPSDNIENVTSETTLANDTSATLDIAKSLYDQGKYEEALGYIDKALADEPTDVDALIG